MRYLSGMARRGNKARTAIRPVSKRNSFAKARPGRWTWSGVKDTAPTGGSYNSVKVTGLISSAFRVINRLPGVTSDELERWKTIDDGFIPRDDPGWTHNHALTDEEMEEKGVEESADIENWGRRLSDDARTDYEVDMEAAEKRQEKHEDQAEFYRISAETDPQNYEYWKEKEKDERAIIDHIETIVKPDLREELDTRLQQIGDNVREERRDLKRELQKEQERSIERAADYVEELRNRIHDEIQAAADRYFETEDLFELQDYHLS